MIQEHIYRRCRTFGWSVCGVTQLKRAVPVHRVGETRLGQSRLSYEGDTLPLLRNSALPSSLIVPSWL